VDDDQELQTLIRAGLARKPTNCGRRTSGTHSKNLRIIQLYQHESFGLTHLVDPAILTVHSEFRDEGKMRGLCVDTKPDVVRFDD